MARTSAQSISPPSLNKNGTEMLMDTSMKNEQQLLPPNLRLNDDILSVHFNNVTSNVKKRHSLSDPNDSLIKYLSSNVTTNHHHHHLQTQPIQVRDDSTNSMLTDTKISPVPPPVVAYENLIDIQNSLNNNNQLMDEQFHCQQIPEQQIMIDSMGSDTESEGDHSDVNESPISSPISITTTVMTSTHNLKSLLKTPTTPKNLTRRVLFDPLALLLDAAAAGEFELLVKAAKDVCLSTCLSLDRLSFLLG